MIGDYRKKNFFTLIFDHFMWPKIIGLSLDSPLFLDLCYTLNPRIVLTLLESSISLKESADLGDGCAVIHLRKEGAFNLDTQGDFSISGVGFTL